MQCCITFLIHWLYLWLCNTQLPT